MMVQQMTEICSRK